MTSEPSTVASQAQRLLFVDDHLLILDALTCLAGEQYEVRAENSLASIEEAVAEFLPNLVILDVSMPDGNSFEVARRILAKHKNVRILFLSMHTDPQMVRKALEVEASGYLSKNSSSSELLQAIRTVLGGQTYVSPSLQATTGESSKQLTDRQVEVLRLICEGCSAKEIASVLQISVRTAEFHRASIMERLKLDSTAMMTRYAIEKGII